MLGKRILVTGSAGFIGSHLVEALLRRGDTVIGLDNFDSFYDRRIKERNIAAAVAMPAYEFIEGDIRDAELVDQIFTSHRFDVVVHLAAKAGVRHSILQPDVFADINLLGTTRLLEASRRHKAPHFVFASSSSVYGDTSVPPFGEGQVADRPSSPYAATKRSGELLCHSYNHLYGLTTTCLRFFTVYGPRQRPEMAIHKFTRLIADGQPVEMFGTGASRRDYTFISDIISGVIAAIDRPNGFRIYNLGTTDTTELSTLIDKITFRLGEPLRVTKLDNQPGDVAFTHADVSLAGNELDYAPTVDIDEGLDHFIAWFRDDRSNSNLMQESDHQPVGV